VRNTWCHGTGRAFASRRNFPPAYGRSWPWVARQPSAKECMSICGMIPIWQGRLSQLYTSRKFWRGLPWALLRPGHRGSSLQRIPPPTPKRMDTTFPSSVMKAAALAYCVPVLHRCHPSAILRATHPAINEATPETS
jgi:hypothetical protein